MNIESIYFKKMIVLLLCCSTVVIADAQRFGFGVHAGLLNSQINGDRLYGYNKWSTQIGLDWSYYLTPEYALQFDMDYLRYGSKYWDEQKPNRFLDEVDYRMLSLDIQAVSMASFFVLKFSRSNRDVSYYQRKIQLGLRYTRAFKTIVIDHTYQNILLDSAYISSASFGPELRIAQYLTKNISIHALFFLSMNNLASNSEIYLKTKELRPFYLGLLVQYEFNPAINKKKKRRVKRPRR